MDIRQVGVEEEFLLVEANGPGLAPRGDAVVDIAGRQRSDGQFEHELTREQAELGSPPVTDLAQLAAQLRQLRLRLAKAAVDQGARLLATGTSPIPGSHHTTAEQRYQRMVDTFGLVGRRQLTCGMHVHVSVDSPAEGVAVLDRIRPWLAVLAALAANSPLLAGEDTGYAGFRSVLWGQWPTAGPTDAFGDVAAYHAVCDQLIAAGAALDEGMLYFDARLSQRYPTVEIRVADVCMHSRDAVVIAGLARALVETAARDWQAGRPTPPASTQLLRAAGWRAARWGTRGELVDILGVRGQAGQPVPAWELIGALVQRVSDCVADAADTDLITAGLADIRRCGTGEQLQRQALARGGPSAVVDLLAELTTEPARVG